MSHLFVCGAAGYTNIGDDAILWGMLTQLRAALPGRAIRVAGGPELEPLVRPFGATPVSYDDRAELARSIEEADLVIIGGGGLLYDVGYESSLSRLLTDPPDRQWLYEMARIASAAGAAARPLLLYSIGAGPLVTDGARRVAEFVCHQAKCITVRDDASAGLLSECGVARSRVHVAADPGVAVRPSETSDVIERLHLSSPPRPLVAINLRPWGDPAQQERLVARAAAAVREIKQGIGGTALLVPFQRMYDDDLPLLQRVAAAATGAVVVEQPLSPPDVAALFSLCDAVIGMRLHALVLALVAGTPFAALSYESKVSEFAESAGMGEHVHSVEGFQSAALVGSVQGLLQDREAVRDRLSEARRRLRQRAALPVALVTDLLETRPVESRRPAVKPSSKPAHDICVVIRIRADYQNRPGGDTVQMEQTKRVLEELGVRVDINAEDSPDLSGYDLMHAFNLGRPEEPYRHCLEAAQQGKPVALSTVYWDFSEFWEWGDPDYWGLPPPDVGLPIPRPAPPPDPIEARRRARLDQQRQAAIECADVYLPNGRGEAELLHESYGLDLSRTVVVTNAVDERFFSARPEPFIEKYGLRDFVLCAARVEKRKNQLALVAAMRGTGLPLVIIGQPNPEAYRELCQRYANQNVTFIDALSHEELAGAYAAARVHALPGWFETPGLSTLEAAAAGCNVVSSDRGTAREYLGDMAWYCDPRDLDSIRAAVLAAYEAPPREDLRELVRQRYTWRRAAESTLEGYRLALALHETRRADDTCEGAAKALRGQADYLAKLAADRAYEAQRMREWAETADAELRRLQREFDLLTSRRLHRWSAAVARAGWRALRALGIKR